MIKILENKFFWIISSLLLILVICLIVLFDNKKTIIDKDLILYGDQEITLKIGDSYKELGFYAIDNGVVVSPKVNITGTVNPNSVGQYIITYSYKDLVKQRIVNVVDNNENILDDDLVIELNGDNVIYLNVSDNYQELGAIASYKDFDITDNIIINGEVNTQIPSEYTISYNIKYNDLEKNIVRKVIVKEVFDLEINYNKELTNQDINLDIKVTGDDYLYLKLPNEVISKNRNLNYKIEENGKYEFIIYDINNNSIVKTIEVNNIDKEKPSGTCSSKYYSEKNETVVTVNASDNNEIDYYLFNQKDKSSSNVFKYNGEISEINVSVYDKALNVLNINCGNTESDKYDFIEMHFIAGVSDDDAILIRTKDKVIMIDGGRYKAKDKVVSYLKDLGIKKIDAMIGSHVHWNHVQAQAAILDNFEVDKVYYSVDIFNCLKLKHCKGSGSTQDNKYIADKLKSKKITPEIWKVGSFAQFGEMKIYNLGPLRNKLTTYENANSLVFILEYKGKKFMFTGDTPSDYMKADTLKTNSLNFSNLSLDVDVFKWPHHGYETLTDSLFNLIKPEYAIIPNCCSCSSKYPSSTNKNIMKKYNTKYYQVCDSKNIVLISDGKTIDIKTKQSASDYKR